jgi:hypothetical protein
MPVSCLRRVLVAAIVLAPRVASALDGTSPASPERDLESAPPALPETPAPHTSAPYSSIAAVGIAQQLYDLDIYGAGLGLSLGGEGQHVGGAANLQFAMERTAAGLSVFDLGLTGTADWKLGLGLRFGVGGGFTVFGIRRATTGGWLASGGPLTVMRLAYDFGPRPCFFLLLEGEASAVGSLNGELAGLVGASLQAGMRF